MGDWGKIPKEKRDEFRDNRKDRAKKRKLKKVLSLGGCQICGYGLKKGDNLSALSFHHLESNKKTDQPSRILKGGTNLSEVENETILVCRNCHWEVFHPKNKNPTARQTKKRRENYSIFLNKNGWECKECKNTLTVLSAFDLHHTGCEKSFNPSRKIIIYHCNEEVKEELDRWCIPLCKNCHMKIHHPKMEIYFLADHLNVPLGEPLPLYL